DIHGRPPAFDIHGRPPAFDTHGRPPAFDTDLTRRDRGVVTAASGLAVELAALTQGAVPLVEPAPPR
ncbi:MAG TPA: hypothetical protein VF426_12745, partial [Marmoricola sp.]